MVVTMIVMDSTCAEYLRTSTNGSQYILDPRLVDNGDYAGSFVLNSLVIDDPNLVQYKEYLKALPQADLDVDLIWNL